MTGETKAKLYNRLVAERDALTPEKIKELSDQIQHKVVMMEEWRVARRVGLYPTYQHEVQTEYLFEEGIRQRKEFYFPAVDPEGKGLAYFRTMNLADLIQMPSGLREPTGKTSKLRDLNMLEAIIVPGLAFDVHGGRMGYGKNFYDNCLNVFRGTRIALAYEFQVVQELPLGVKGRKLDWIVTEERIIKCR